MLAVQWCAPKTASVVTVSDLMCGLCYPVAVQKLPAVALQCLILASGRPGLLAALVKKGALTVLQL